MKSYSITALAREQGLSRSTLLYYDRIDLLRPQSRSEANYRCYGEEQRQRLGQIGALAEQSGYRVIGGFNLPQSDWWKGFYLPLQAQVAQMRAQNAGNAIAEAVYEFHDTEIEMYRRYHRYYGYRFVLLQRTD